MNTIKQDPAMFDKIEALIHQFASEIEHNPFIKQEQIQFRADEPLFMAIEENSLVFVNPRNSQEFHLSFKLDTFQCIAKKRNHALKHHNDPEKEENKEGAVQQIFVTAPSDCCTGAMISNFYLELINSDSSQQRVWINFENNEEFQYWYDEILRY